MYLKIRDDVDLKELEKFGFYEIFNFNRFRAIYEYKNKNGNNFVIMYVSDREIKLETSKDEIIDKELICKLYDLIQAGLVEKVEE